MLVCLGKCSVLLAVIVEDLVGLRLCKVKQVFQLLPLLLLNFVSFHTSGESKTLLMSSAIKTLLFRLIITIVYGCEEVLSDKFCFTANNESISWLRIQ